MKHYKKSKTERRARPRHRPNPAEWMLEPYARGETMRKWEVEARAMALNAGYAGYEQIRRAIDRHEARRKVMAEKHAPAYMLNRYTTELEILRRALAVMERELYERMAFKAR